MDRSAALRPLAEVAESAHRLREHRSAAELNDAVAAVADALDRSVRLALRDDPEAAQEHRASALSAEVMSTEDVVRSLRARDRISLETAAGLHQMTGAVARARAGDATTADADLARTTRELLLHDLGQTGPAPVGAPDPLPPHAPAPAAGPASEPPVSAQGTGRWMAWAGAAFALLFLLGLAWVLAGGGDDDFDAGVAAFRAERWDSAAVAFERVLRDRPVDVTTRLYLGRIYRRQGRLVEAAGVLREAVRVAPDDADIRREMGHLLLQMEDPVAAAAEYERALEHDPDSFVAWVGLVRALRAAGDPRAERVLEEAPADVRATLGQPGR